LLQRAENALKSNNKNQIFSAYNDYKNLYLKALIDDDVLLQQKSLNGIIASGVKLHIDVSDYKEKLTHFTAETVAKPVEHTSVAKADTSKKSDKKIKIIQTHHISDVQWKDNQLTLTFSTDLTQNRVNYFTLLDKKKRSYKYVFDIHTSLLGKNYSLKNSQLKRVSLSQYKHDTVRLVIENTQALKLRFHYEGNVLVIKPGIQSNLLQPAPILQPDIKKRVIVIDPGHGGKDSGAIGYKKHIYEKNIVFQISKELSKILKEKGHTVYLTRNKDIFIKLRHRTEFANKKNADIFISIHANAIPKSSDTDNTYGIETYFLSPSKNEKAERVAEKENIKDIDDMNHYGKDSFLNFLNREKILASNKLGIDLQQGTLSVLRKKYSNVRDGGVRKGPFWVLVGAQMPAVLVEVGFVSNPMEAKRLTDSKYQKHFAQGVAEGIERYFAKNP
jgi:N-acetylmuramoyl-L-alanine amidase